MNDNVISISHASDIDGVGSAALIKMKYGVKTGNIFFTDYSPESLESIRRSIKRIASAGAMLFITDLGVNAKTVPIFYDILKSIKEKGGKIFWFDHHPWDGKAIKRLAPMCEVSILGENDLFCATEITRKELGFEDKFTKEFCRIVHFSDFAIKPKAKKDYNMVGFYALAIAFYRMKGGGENLKGLRHIVDVLCSGRMLDVKIRNDANAYRKINDRNAASMLRDVYLGEDIALGFAGDIQKTYACMKLMEKTGKDIGIYVNVHEMRGHMRSVKNDLTALANRFGGGGHPHASGFTPNARKYNRFRTRKDRQRLLSDIERELKLVQSKNGLHTAVKASRARTPLFG